MILIALGSNLGDRAEYLRQARIALAVCGVKVMRESTIHETPALLPAGATTEWNRSYLNQVMSVTTELTPRQLLESLKDIEEALGRADREHWAPREIDLDVIAYGDEVMATKALTLPHPQMHLRKFVLAPLVEIAPEWLHPTLGKTAKQLLAELPA